MAAPLRHAPSRDRRHRGADFQEQQASSLAGRHDPPLGAPFRERHRRAIAELRPKFAKAGSPYASRRFIDVILRIDRSLAVAHW